MEKELFVIEDGDISFNVIDWGDHNTLNISILEDGDEVSSMGFLLNVKDIKNLIRVLQSWVEA
jgi:hypothetical protein